MIAGEGDVTITGDQFEIQKLTSNNWELLSHGGNSPTNFFNGSIFTGGNSSNPNLVNNTGMDISMFTIPNPENTVIGNGQTSTKFRYSSTQDTYIIYSICMAVDAYEPVVEGFLTTLSVNNVPTTSSSITVMPGDEIKYKVEIRNKGNEAVNNARLEIPLPYAAIRYQGSTVNVSAPAVSSALPYVDASLGANGTLVWDFGTLPLPSDPNTVLGEIIFTLKASEDCELYRNFNCSAPSVEIDGNISGVGANTQISVEDQPFYVGFSNVDGCSTEPLLGPFNIDINSASWLTANCPVTDGVRDFTYCNRTTSIPITDVLGFYPVGTRFFNTDQTEEYTIANPFPDQPGPVTYSALLPGSSCVLSFTISITNISSVPTVSTSTAEYCRNDAAVALTATPSNPSYLLFYYAPSSSIAQPLLIPSTVAEGNFVYQVAEGPSSNCISTGRANISVRINDLPNITATPTEISCFGGTGSIALAANGGTGDLTFNTSNPSTSNLTAGSYTYQVSDSKGCDASATALINAAPDQPAQPSLECYQTATFNTTSCSWDVTGTQAPRPTTACYETATFNTLSCSWDVTGTQPQVPATACYETATLNTSSCSWDVTGTQPQVPATACYETATFNTSSCSWDVTGTPPVQPEETIVACSFYNWNGSTYTTSGDYTFVSLNNSGCTITSTLHLTINNVPSIGGITGPQSVCRNQSGVVFSVAPVNGATSYTWILPNGITSSSATNTITVSVSNSFTSGIIQVRANNACGSSLFSQLTVTGNSAPSIGGITGPQSVCRNQSGVVFSVAPVNGATSYTWVLPNGLTGSSTTNSISVSVNNTFTSGVIKVRANNSCGSCSYTQKTVNAIVHAPSTPGAISGPINVCVGGTYSYSISPVSGATGYVWTVSGVGVSIISGQGTTSIVVSTTTSLNCATISVKSSNCSRLSSARTRNIIGKKAPIATCSIAGSSTVCKTQTKLYSVNSVSGAGSYTWRVTGGATFVGSSTGTSVYVKFNNATSLNVVLSVTANNECGSSPSISKNIHVNSGCRMMEQDEQTLTDNQDLDLNGVSAEDFALYPNPNNGNFWVTLTSNKAARYSFEIIDMTGRLVYQSNEEYEAGTNIKEFALLNVKGGLYFVRILQNNKTIKSMRIVLQ
jgi:uncharacterized repeat protein (TIGR01451 family)